MTNEYQMTSRESEFSYSVSLPLFCIFINTLFAFFSECNKRKFVKTKASDSCARNNQHSKNVRVDIFSILTRSFFPGYPFTEVIQRRQNSYKKGKKNNSLFVLLFISDIYDNFRMTGKVRLDQELSRHNICALIITHNVYLLKILFW